MIEITVAQFKTDVDKYVSSALTYGDAYRIGAENGNVVLMDETEYDTLREALKMLLEQK